jgi:hypothetical protein
MRDSIEKKICIKIKLSAKKESKSRPPEWLSQQTSKTFLPHNTFTQIS